MRKNEPQTAFIVINWNNEELLKECLESISQQSQKDYRTILVDNGSHDNSIAAARKVMSDLTILDTGVNNGFARGNNIGINEALKDPTIRYIALLNTDARLDKDWLKYILEFCKNKPNAALLQGTTLNYFDHRTIDSTHLYVTRGGQGAQGNWQEVYIEESGPKKVFGVNAAACLITRDFIEGQPYKNLFDESFFMYLEDVDISSRATIMGWDNYLVPGARAYHMGSASSGGNAGYSSYGLYMTFRNNLAMLVTNFPISILVRLMFKIPLTDYRTIRHLWRQGNKEAARKVLAGRLVGVCRSPYYILKRWKMTGKRQIDPSYLWLLMKQGL